MDIELTELQWRFYNAKEDEVLFGGAAGGGKTHGQILDAFLYACDYPGIKQLVLRRTFGELEKSFIRGTLATYPKEVAKYNDSKKKWTFKNGSIVEFGYCDNEKDVYKYQSAEYDIIRFDEATHFTEFMYIYLKSRNRGVNNFPKQIKSTTNPGGVGHTFFKERFIDNGTKEYQDEEGTRLFIPAKLKDNKFLMESDPNYRKRLLSLPEKERQALLDGDWDIYDGMFFREFKRDIHVIEEPFEIPNNWTIYISLDYGLDMFAPLFVAIDPEYNVYVIDEIHESNLLISEAAKKLRHHDLFKRAKRIFAPPDLWNRRQDTGKSAYDIFAENGVRLTKCSSDRVNGWLAVKEWIKPIEIKDEQTGETIKTAKLRIFSKCKNLIRCLPQLQHDDKNPNDVATEPHELTHITDALRYFCVSKTLPGQKEQSKPIRRYDKSRDFGETIKPI